MLRIMHATRIAHTGDENVYKAEHEALKLEAGYKR
jgi:hypothetical protein